MCISGVSSWVGPDDPKSCLITSTVLGLRWRLREDMGGAEGSRVTAGTMAGHGGEQVGLGG